jgi:hypothetical protein
MLWLYLRLSTSNMLKGLLQNQHDNYENLA